MTQLCFRLILYLDCLLLDSLSVLLKAFLQSHIWAGGDTLFNSLFTTFTLQPYISLNLMVDPEIIESLRVSKY